jgi:hypothetical protein
LVLVGEELDRSSVADLEQHARVLAIESNDAAPEQVRQAVAVLMPLELPTGGDAGVEPLAAVAGRLPSLSEEHEALLHAATVGPESVRDALRRYIDGAATGREGDGI